MFLSPVSCKGRVVSPQFWIQSLFPLHCFAHWTALADENKQRNDVFRAKENPQRPFEPTLFSLTDMPNS